jgi:putative transposase
MQTKSKMRCRKAPGSHLSPQRTFAFTRREGHRIGRKPSPDSGVSHQTREPLASRFPVHVVLRLDEGLPTLRNKRAYQVLRRSFAAGCDRFGFRLNHYSVQGTHLHFIVEAKDRESLSRGLKGLAVRIAKGLNKLWSRKGRVFGDRYFDRILRTPLEVKNALRYVLKNGNKHGAHRGPGPDPFSSGAVFTGWRDLTPGALHAPPSSPVAAARTWLQNLGWRLHGLISVTAPWPA